VWIAGVAATVVGSLVLAVLTWVGPQIIDGAAVKDWLREAARADGDLRYTVEYVDGGFDLVLPQGATLTNGQKSTLKDWSTPANLMSGLQGLVEELRAAGAADPNVLTVRVTLEGRRNQPIKVDAIEPVNIRRQAPYSGIFLSIPPQGPGNTIKLMFNLDEVQPIARVAVPVKEGDPPKPTEKDDIRPGPPFFQNTTLTVNDGQEDAIVIQSVATRWATSFDIRIAYRVGDQAKSLIINNAGHPFAVTPLNCTDHSTFADGHPDAPGHVSYQQVWEIRNDFTGADTVANPNHFEIGFPYC
jgi:hypothetical protein